MAIKYSNPIYASLGSYSVKILSNSIYL